jgi:hypothetical protein
MEAAGRDMKGLNAKLKERSMAVMRAEVTEVNLVGLRKVR